MAYRYRTIKKRNGINDKENYYASPVNSGLIDTYMIADELAGRSSLTPADIRATLIGLVDVMEYFLHNGYSVKLDDLGIFSVSVTSDGYENPGDCMPHRVRANKLCFRADVRIKEKLKHIEFERKKEIK
jgi:predicted histone-like DNA-binding protein